MVRSRACTFDEGGVHGGFSFGATQCFTRPFMPTAMRTRPLARLLPPVVAALALAAGPSAGWAGRQDDHDHDRARAALQAGDVLPLDRVLQQVAQTHPGQVMAVELEREQERWVYELKLLQPGGGLLKLEVDARSGEVLRRKEKAR